MGLTLVRDPEGSTSCTSSTPSSLCSSSRDPCSHPSSSVSESVMVTLGIFTKKQTRSPTGGRSPVPVSDGEQLRPPRTGVLGRVTHRRPLRTGVFGGVTHRRPPRTGVFGRVRKWPVRSRWHRSGPGGLTCGILSAQPLFQKLFF
jgi:hypothetical protein